MHNAADPEQVEHAERRQKDKRTRLRDLYQAISALPNGVMLYARFHEYTQGSSFSRDPLEMAFAEGKRAAAQEFLTEYTNANPDAMAQYYAARALEAKRA